MTTGFPVWTGSLSSTGGGGGKGSSPSSGDSSVRGSGGRGTSSSDVVITSSSPPLFVGGEVSTGKQKAMNEHLKEHNSSGPKIMKLS